MSEDYKVQASLKFGPGLSGLLNVRANSVEELLGLLDDSIGDLPVKLGAVTEELTALANIGAAFPGAAVVSNTGGGSAAAAGGGGKTCIHGPMTERWGNRGTSDEWHGWFCNQPRGAADKCKPIYAK